jgi:hypothetical protein
MKPLRVRCVLSLLAAVSVLALACASPPDAEKRAADAAVSAATAAGAEKYAPGEFAAMTASLKKAEAEMSDKSYKEAKASYEATKDLADRAARAAEAGKAAAKADAEKQLADLEARWRDLQARAEAATRRLKAEEKTIWDAAGIAIGAAFTEARGAVASDAAAAKAKLAVIPAQLDKWEAGVTALAAAPRPEEKAPAAKPAGRPAARR